MFLKTILSLLIIPAFAAESFTVDDVARHNTTSDCYMIYDGKVYDFTTYLREHDDYYYDIDAWCGSDMTEAFETKDGRGVDHKSRTYLMLDSYYVGDLVAVEPIIEEPVVNDSEVTELTEDHEEEYSIEISGEELKTYTIQEIADMWGIDAEELLAGIIQEFSLKSDYTVNNVLDSLRAEYKFSPALVKDIAEEIKLGTSDSEDVEESVVTEEKTTKTQSPYNFAIPFFGTLFTYFVSEVLVRIGKDKKDWRFNKTTERFFWNTVLIISLVPSAIFGFYLVLRYSIPVLSDINFDFLYWHVEGSIVFGTVCVIHFIERLKMYFAQFRTLKR